MKYITSSSTNDGVSTITATFDLTRNPDLATVDIENRVNTASGRLPAAVKQIGITVAKTSQNFVFGGAVFSDPTAATPRSSSAIISMSMYATRSSAFPASPTS